MRRIRVLAIDVDGTITVSPSEYTLYLPAVELINRLSERFVTILVSGNSAPMMIGLARYIKTSGYVVAENGGSIAIGDEITWLCSDHEQEILSRLEEEIYDKYKSIISKSWQNNFMKCSKAFKKIKSSVDTEEIIDSLKKYVASRGLGDLYIASSKVAIHINPSRLTKALGVEKILERLGFSWSEVLAVGDSDIDVDLIERAELGCAVANASDKLKRVAKCFSQYEAGRGFVDIVTRYLGL